MESITSFTHLCDRAMAEDGNQHYSVWVNVIQLPRPEVTVIENTILNSTSLTKV